MMDTVQPNPALPGRIGRLFQPALILALAALLLVGWQWWDTRTRIHALQAELGRRLAEADSASKESRVLSRQAIETTRDISVKLGEIQARLAESQNQQLALEALYQELARSRDEWTLADIEQIVLSASQQLQLAGNVKAALIALQSADTRLQRLNKPQFTALRRAINADMQRLQALPQVDTIGIILRLDALIAQADELPLASEHEIPAAPARKEHAQPADAATRFGREMWQELKGLVQVRRLDAPDSALLVPEQAYFLRQNLKLRLLTARIALLARDEVSYKADLMAARSWLARYFNTRDARTASALASLDKLAGSPISIQLPTLAASLTALAAARPVR